MRMLYTIFSLCFVCMVLHGKELFAQQPLYQEEVHLPFWAQITLVNGIAADKNNCIWFSTQTGLYRYDGSRFRHFSVLNTKVLQFERMAGLPMLLDKDGTRWCIQDGKGYNYEIDSLSRIEPLSNTNGPQIIYSTIPFPYNSNGANNNINKDLAKNIEEINVVKTGRMLYISGFNRNVIRITIDDFLKGGEGNIIHTSKPRIVGRSFTTDNRFYLLTDEGFLCWKNDGVNPLKPLLTGDIAGKGAVIDYTRLKVFKTSNPDIVLLWYNGNIYKAEWLANSINIQTTLLANTSVDEPPQTLYYSPVQQLLISYFFKKGLTFYRPIQFSLLSYDYPRGVLAPDGDYHYVALPYQGGFITANKAGLIWLGKDGTNRFLNDEPVGRFFVFIDKLGDIWYQDNRNYSLQCLQAGKSNPVPVFSLGTYMSLAGMYQQDDSTYLILTRKYFKKVILKNKKFIRSELLDSITNTLEFNMLFPVNSTQFWVGSDRGLFQYDAVTGKTSKVETLSNVYIRSAVKLAENNYLLGTYDKGIYQFINNKWIQLTCSEKNMPSSAHAFIVDKLTSSVWVSSNDGIIQIPLKQLLNNKGRTDGDIEFRHFSNFGPGISSEFNGSSNVSGAMLSDSCIAFSNANGLVMFNPVTITMPPLPVNILVEPMNEGNADSITANAVYSGQLQFRPVVPYWGNLQELEILFRVTNTDDKWNKLSTNSVINYSNLSPGNHKLQFRVRQYNNPENNQVFITAKDFDVPYPWYKKAWFLVLASLLFIGLLILLHNIRIWYIVKRKRQLRQLVNRKTKELLETNEYLKEVIRELSDSETNLKQSNFLKDEYYALLTHDLRSPLKFLSFNLSRMLNHIPATDNKRLKEGLFVAYECSNELEKLVEEFVYWIRNNDGQLKLFPEMTDIGNTVKDVQKIYGYGFEANKNILINEIPDGFLFKTDPRIFFIILRNSIDNANKYTQGGRINIKARIENDQLLITIADTGRGMSEEMIAELMNIQDDDKKGFKQRASLGFYIMNMLTQKLGGSYDITSSKDKGTTLNFVFPELEQELKK